MKEKKFIIRKFVTASSALDAIRKDKSTPVHEVYRNTETDEEEKKDMGFTKKL